MHTYHSRRTHLRLPFTPITHPAHNPSPILSTHSPPTPTTRVEGVRDARSELERDCEFLHRAAA